jgi:hypothetical protein
MRPAQRDRAARSRSGGHLVACKGDRRGNRGQHNRTGRVGASPAGRKRETKWRGDDALGRSARKAGDNLAKDRCGTKARGVIRCGCYQGLASTAGERRPARLLRSSRVPLAEATAACEAKARDGKVLRFATERRHCQSFGEFRAGLRRWFNACCRGRFCMRTRRTSKRVRHVCTLRR